MASSSHPIPSSPSIIAPPHRDEDDDKATGSNTEEISEGAFPSAAASARQGMECAEMRREATDARAKCDGMVAGLDSLQTQNAVLRKRCDQTMDELRIKTSDLNDAEGRMGDNDRLVSVRNSVASFEDDPCRMREELPISQHISTVASEQLMGFHKHQNEVQLIESCVYPDFLDCNPGLNDEITTFLDELYLSEFRKPWSPGDGICISADAPYNCNHQMSIHRKSYLRQNYGKENSTITTATDGNTFRWSYGTGSGRITHGIPKR